jgi:hypothetical protein
MTSDFWAVTLIAEPEVLEGLDPETGPDLEAGEATPLDSEVDALDSPLGADDAKAIFDLVTYVAGSVAAIAEMSRALIEVARKLRKPVEVADSAGRKVITVTVETDESVLIDEISVKCKVRR